MTKSIYDQLVTSNTNSLVYNVLTGGSQFNGMASDAPSGGVRARQGVKILANFAGIGSQIQNVTIGIRKNGTVSGLVNVQYINSSYTVLATASMNASDLGTGDKDAYTFKLSSQVTIASGDRLLIQYSGTAWSNGVILNGASGTAPTNTSYTYEGTLNSNSFTEAAGVPMMSFDSVLSGVTRQRFVETFTGDSLDTDRWTTGSFNTAPTFQMGDSIDGGFEIVCAASNNTGGNIIFGSTAARQFSPTGSVFICVAGGDNVRCENFQGFVKDHVAFNNFRNMATIQNVPYEGVLFSHTSNASGDTQTNSGSAFNSTTNVYKVECKPSECQFSTNGVIGSTVTTTLPVVTMQPRFGVRSHTNTSQSFTGKCTYMECYNT